MSTTDTAIKFNTDWAYAPAPESASSAKFNSKYELFINGKFTPPVKGKYFPTINPANEKKLADIADATSEDVNAAVKAARQAYDKTWSKMPAKERGKYIYRIARIIQERARELAIIETMNGGKSIRESRDVDVPLVAAHFFYYAGWADKLEYAFPGKMPTPAGVAGQVIPWNFPLLMAAWKIAPALACGCTVVLKPAGDDAADVAEAGGDYPGRGFAAGSGEYCHRRRRDRRGAGESSGDRQGRVHGIDGCWEDHSEIAGRDEEEIYVGTRRKSSEYCV